MFGANFLRKSLAPGNIDARGLVGSVWLYANDNEHSTRTLLTHLWNPLMSYLVVVWHRVQKEANDHGARVGVQLDPNPVIVF